MEESKKEEKINFMKLFEKYEKKIYWMIIFILIFLIGLSYIFYNVLLREKNKLIENQELLKAKILEKKIQKERKDDVINGVQAKAILVEDFETGKIILQKNSNDLLPVASLTKLVNTLVALEKKSLEDKIKVNSLALKSYGNYGLKGGEEFNLKDLISGMLIGSVNDLAVAVALSGPKKYSKNWISFMEEMNNETKKIGAKDTIFFTETGLNVNDRILGGYSTAQDIAKIVKELYKKNPEIFKSTAQKTFKLCSQKFCHQIENTNILLEKYPEIIFSKTGYTEKAMGSLVTVVELNGKKYLIVILDSTKQGRFDDFEKILDLLIKK